MLTYTYDDNGSLIQQVSSLNGTTNYAFDLENRLVSAVTPSSSAYYGYSGDGRRTYSYIDYNEVEYIYDGLTPLIERSGPGTYIAAYTRLPGAPGGIGGLISSHDGTNTLYYHDSSLGNVNQVTNSAGAVIQTYDYDAFGNITAQTGALTAKYAYKTKEYSPETGLIFFGRRYYNPLVGRFITLDPSGMADGPNMYLYLNNDPINKYDPWGLSELGIWENNSGFDDANWWASNRPKMKFSDLNLCDGIYLHDKQWPEDEGIEPFPLWEDPIFLTLLGVRLPGLIYESSTITRAGIGADGAISQTVRTVSRVTGKTVKVIHKVTKNGKTIHIDQKYP